jgi:hypothetical protein
MNERKLRSVLVVHAKPRIQHRVPVHNRISALVLHANRQTGSAQLKYDTADFILFYFIFQSKTLQLLAT